MGYDALKERVCAANKEISRTGLAILTWGNASAIDRSSDLVVIKPSGVPYDAMSVNDIVVVDLDGNVVEGALRPSSDLPTHLALYLAWPDIGGVVHTHSMHATMYAQACRPIPCYGTTHADHFHGDVPCTRMMTVRETQFLLRAFPSKTSTVPVVYGNTMLRSMASAAMKIFSVLRPRLGSALKKEWRLVSGG